MHGVIPAQEMWPPRGFFAGLAKSMHGHVPAFGWFVPIRRSYPRPGVEWCEAQICLLVTDRSGSSFCGWVPFVVDCGTDVSIIPRRILPEHAFRGPDIGLCPVSGLLGGTGVGRRYPASVSFRAPKVDGPSIHIAGLEPVVADVWHEEFGYLGMDVLQRLAMISDGQDFSFWPLPLGDTEDESTIQEEVQQLLLHIRDQSAQERLKAATDLNNIGIHLRGTARVRGSLSRAASEPVQGLSLKPALEALDDVHWEIRREVALVLGEWGDEEVLSALEWLAKKEPEWRVREAVAHAFATIGGPRAIELLTNIIKTDPHPAPVKKAIAGLGELALLNAADQPASASISQGKSSPTRGTVRARWSRLAHSPDSPPKIDMDTQAIKALIEEARYLHPDASARKVAEEILQRITNSE